MRRIRVPLVVLAAAWTVAGCGQADTDAGPGGVTVGEARALDEAAQMLEERRLPPEALESGQPAESPPGQSTEPGSGEP